jgi:adenosylhomocysteine nucleosidase
VTAGLTVAAADNRLSGQRLPQRQGPVGIIAPLLIEGRCIDLRVRPGVLTRCGSSLVHVCGMGSERASAAVEALIERGCSLLVSFGTAGALVPGLASGDILLTADVRTDGSAERACANLTPSEFMQALRQRLDASNRLRLIADAAIASSREALTGRSVRESFARHTQAVAVDMESAAIACLAKEAGVPFLGLRCIVDTLESGLPEGMQEHVDAFGEPRWSLAGWALARPRRAFALVDLGLRMSRARRSLRACARALLEAGAEGIG